MSLDHYRVQPTSPNYDLFEAKKSKELRRVGDGSTPSKGVFMDGCTFKTPVTLLNDELVYRYMDMHNRSSHINLVPPTTGQTTGESSSSRARADKLPRPQLREGATEADFIYSLDSWTRYKRSTELSGQEDIDHGTFACACTEQSCQHSDVFVAWQGQ